MRKHIIAIAAAVILLPTFALADHQGNLENSERNQHCGQMNKKNRINLHWAC